MLSGVEALTTVQSLAYNMPFRLRSGWRPLLYLYQTLASFNIGYMKYIKPQHNEIIQRKKSNFCINVNIQVPFLYFTSMKGDIPKVRSYFSA